MSECSDTLLLLARHSRTDAAQRCSVLYVAPPSLLVRQAGRVVSHNERTGDATHRNFQLVDREYELVAFSGSYCCCLGAGYDDTLTGMDLACHWRISV